MSEPPSPLRQDLARGLTRALVLSVGFVGLAGGLALAFSDRFSASQAPVLLVSAALIGLFPIPLTLIERRAKRCRLHAGWAVLQVWLCAVVLSALATVQGTYLEAVIRKGSVAGGFSEVVAAVQGMWGDTGDMLLLFAAQGLPFAGAALVHLRSDRFGRRLGIALALAFVPCAFGVGTIGVALLAVAILTTLISIAYGLATLLHPRLWRFGYREEVAYLRKLAAEGQLHAGRIFLLALVDHEPARQLRGLDAPEPEPDLLRWVRRLEKGGERALLRAANAARHLVDDPEVTAELGLDMRRLAVDAAREAARAHGEQEVRRAIREAVVAYALEPKDRSAS